MTLEYFVTTILRTSDPAVMRKAADRLAAICEAEGWDARWIRVRCPSKDVARRVFERLREERDIGWKLGVSCLPHWTRADLRAATYLAVTVPRLRAEYAEESIAETHCRTCEAFLDYQQSELRLTVHARKVPRVFSTHRHVVVAREVFESLRSAEIGKIRTNPVLIHGRNGRMLLPPGEAVSIVPTRLETAADAPTVFQALSACSACGVSSFYGPLGPLYYRPGVLTDPVMVTKEYFGESRDRVPAWLFARQAHDVLSAAGGVEGAFPVMQSGTAEPAEVWYT